MSEKILALENVSKTFGFGKNKTEAVKEVSLVIEKQEVISIVGESGSGKTTLAKMMLGLLAATEGTILYKEKAVKLKKQKAKKLYWSKVQAVFQDPFACFNMFYTVDTLLNHSIQFIGVKPKSAEAACLKREACSYVNLDFDELKEKHAYALSGGQMQRLMIARIFILKPEVLIADEPTSMIDACSRSQILDALLKLGQKTGMTIIFITHDLGLAYYLSDKLCIMEKGKIVEYGSSDQVITNPQADYTKRLLQDVPHMKGKWLEEDLD